LRVSTKSQDVYHLYSRLDGGAAEEEGRLSSSASLALFRPPGVWRARFAADMLVCSGGLAALVAEVEQGSNDVLRYLVEG